MATIKKAQSDISAIEKISRARKLHERIDKCANEIHTCEDLLVSLGVDDLDDETTDVPSLWINLRWVQNGRTSHLRDFGKLSEFPCFSIAAFLEMILKNTPLSGLLMRGCSIRIQDNLAHLNISCEVPLGNIAQIDEYRPQSNHHRKQL